MDYTVHEVTKSCTQLSNFHFLGREEVKQNEKRRICVKWNNKNKYLKKISWYETDTDSVPI